METLTYVVDSLSLIRVVVWLQPFRIYLHTTQEDKRRAHEYTVTNQDHKSKAYRTT